MENIEAYIQDGSSQFEKQHHDIQTVSTVDQGNDAIQSLFSSAENEVLSKASVRSPERLDSPMDLLKQSVDGYLEREKELDSGLNGMNVLNQPNIETFDDFKTRSIMILEMQKAYNEKSLNGAMLLNTGRSSESFVKTLMRSQ